MNRKESKDMTNDETTTLHIGDKIKVSAFLDSLDNCATANVTGTVVYIHPQHRYYSVKLPSGIIQSFAWGTNK